VLCFSGLDPTGGAGIQADIESLFSHNCHCFPLITLNSIQDSANVYRIIPTENYLLEEQFNCLYKDISRVGKKISSVKIGMLGNFEQVDFISSVIKNLTNAPIVFDPVFASGLGTKTATEKQIENSTKKILPFSTIATPNTIEALQLAKALKPSLTEKDSSELIAKTILSTGLKSLLITGTHAEVQHDFIEHQLFTKMGEKIFKVPRLYGEYHGSGCTLSSALAANLANGLSLESSIKEALNFTQKSLEHAQQLGEHQQFPNRKLTTDE